MTLNVFPWATLPDQSPFAERFTLSADGDTAVMLLNQQVGTDERLVSYSFETGRFGFLAPAFDIRANFNTNFRQAVSDDATRVALVTPEALVATDIDNQRDVYILDVATGGFTLVEPEGLARNTTVEVGALSGDGSTVALLVSKSGDHYSGAVLADPGSDAQTDLGALAVAAGIDGADRIQSVTLSDDGALAAFRLNNDTQLIYDGTTGTLRNLDDIASGFEFGSGQQIVLSGDGRYVFFHTNNAFSDRAAGLVRVTLADGTVDYVFEANTAQPLFSVTDDGRYVAFQTFAGDLVAQDPGDDGTRENDIFVADMDTSEITLLGRDDGGFAARFNGADPLISDDATRLLTFANLADTLDFRSPDYGNVYWLEGYGNWLPAIEGTGGPDRLTGTAGDDFMRGLGGDDTLSGLAGDDTIDGGDGTDNLIGGAGNDSITGGVSENDLRDNIFGGDGNDTIRGGYGNDNVRGDAGDDLVEGGFGADTVLGGTGNDSITGSGFGDLLFGAEGDDFINGGFGFDRVNGGDGADEFFHLGVAGHGTDFIQDYDGSEGDTLVFGNTGASAGQFQINLANTPDAGDGSVEEAFIIYRPTGQIMWALIDGAAQDEINLKIGGETFDLMT